MTRTRTSTLLRCLAFYLATVAIAIVVSMVIATGIDPLRMLIAGAVGAALTFGLTFAFVRLEGVRLAEVGARFAPRSVRRFALGILLGLVLVAVHSALVYADGHIRYVEAPEFRSGQAIPLLLAYVALAAREELAFRGFPLFRLDSIFGFWPAQISIALLFALEHMLGGWNLLDAFAGAALGSLMFGACALATRGLALPIGLHAAWNLADWIRGGKAQVGMFRPIVEAGFEQHVAIVGYATYAVVVGCVVAGCLWWRSRRSTTLD